MLGDINSMVAANEVMRREAVAAAMRDRTLIAFDLAEGLITPADLAEVRAEFGPVDILVNKAGSAPNVKHLRRINVPLS